MPQVHNAQATLLSPRRCRCALVPTAQACTATWGCRVMPDAKRRSMRRLQGESQVPACVPWWFLNYTPEQQNQYLVDVDDADSQVGGLAGGLPGAMVL